MPVRSRARPSEQGVVYWTTQQYHCLAAASELVEMFARGSSHSSFALHGHELAPYISKYDFLTRSKCSLSLDHLNSCCIS